MKNEKKKLELKNQIAEQELSIAKIQLEQFLTSLQQKNEQIDILLKASENNSVDEETIQQLQKSILLTEEQWDDFKQIFDKVHKGYINKIFEKIPTVSPTELRFIALVKLQLDQKQIASALGISNKSVYNIWYRLRKKANMEEADSWKILLDVI